MDNTLSMPRSHVNNVGSRSYKNYNPNDIKNAVDAVRNKKITIRTVITEKYKIHFKLTFL